MPVCSIVLLLPDRTQAPWADLQAVIEILRLDAEFVCVGNPPVGEPCTPAPRSRGTSLHESVTERRWVAPPRPYDSGQAISRAIEAARGELAVIFDPTPGYVPGQIGWLLARLARWDLACGRRRRSSIARAWLRLWQFPRRAIFGRDRHDPECLFWAARREALAGVDLSRGRYRFVASLVAARGYRVGEISIDTLEHGIRYRPHAAGLAEWNPVALGHAWWTCRQMRTAQRAESPSADRRLRFDIATSAVRSSPDGSASSGRVTRSGSLPTSTGEST